MSGEVIRLSPNARVGYIVDEASGCWLWGGYIMRDGYGRSWDAKRRRVGRAHRVVYEAVRGMLDDRLDIDHLCRVRRCVNPDHMEQVTRAVNLRRGSGAKLNWEAVREIRRRYADGGVPIRVFAAEFGVSGRQISDVTLNRSWRDPAYTPPFKVTKRPPPNRYDAAGVLVTLGLAVRDAAGVNGISLR